MELGVTLRQSQEQRLLLLPRMLQAIEILQLSSRDLLSMVERELAENETLELAPSDVEPPAPETDSREVEPDDLEPDAGPTRIRDDDRPDLMGQMPAHNLSLHGHLLSQLAMLEVEDPVREIVSFLIGSLDSNGHLLLGRTELLELFEQEAVVDAALALLRSLEPKGVGCSGPLASMLAQIDATDPDAPYLESLVRDHLDDLAKNRMPRVAKKLGISIEDVKSLVEKLRGLDPCPGRAFQEESFDILHPDVVVRWEDGEWQVYVDEARVPPLVISKDYEALSQDNGAPRRVRSYLKDKLGSAKELMAAIAQRKDTLGRVARAVVDRQPEFLAKGLAGLRPLKMQEVADAIGVHLSTVSRATAEKFIQTDAGIFPMRRLFDGGKAVGANERGEGGESRMSVKERIRRVVEAEDSTQPLSDDDIVKALQTDGLKVARRTVAKYRKELGIPSSWRRRAY